MRGTGKHMADRLPRYAPVLYVDPPMSVLTPLRRPHLAGSLLEPRLRLVRPGLARLTPVVNPGVSRPVLRDLAIAMTRQAMARAVRRLGGSVHAVVGASFDRVFDACGEDLRVLYATDDFAAGGDLMDIGDDWLARRERAQLATVDRVVAVSPALAQRWRAQGHDVTLITNGCDPDSYADVDAAPLPPTVDLPGPVALFVGHLSERIDIALLEAVADTGLSLLLVGPRRPGYEPGRFDALVARDTVQWVGRQPFEALPSYLRVAAVGLTPYADTAFNRGSFPLKTLEYLAAGRPAVITDLPSARWLDTDLVTIAGSPEEFAQAALRCAHEAPSPQLAEERRAFARRNSWDVRVRELAKVLDLPL
ncbi:MAG TPA: glycosyltransferase [Actinomycetales bacterium]